jgi:hypothetical protein
MTDLALLRQFAQAQHGTPAGAVMNAAADEIDDLRARCYRILNIAESSQQKLAEATSLLMDLANGKIPSLMPKERGDLCHEK